jgi:hypothetical protein
MRAALLLSCLLAFACTSSGGDNALTLTIASDLMVPDELDRVTVSVEGQETSQDPAADLRAQGLPRTLTLVHHGGPLGPFAIKVYGWLGMELVIQRELSASFSASGDLSLTVMLDRRCRNVMCAPGQTCESGSCTPLDPGIELDAGADAARPDAARDASTAGDALAEDAQRADVSMADANGEDAGEVDARSAEDAALDAPDASDAAPAGAGAPPVCTVALPVSGDSYQANLPVALRGTCSDPETGALSTVSWTSQRDGMLGSGPSVNAALASLGAQRITLCARDPHDPNLLGCASADVEVTLDAQPAVSIGMLTQGGSNMPPFSAAAPLSFSGVGSGAGVTLSWSDDVQGTLGSGATAQLAMPLVGRHTVTLTVQDRNGVQRAASRPYVVVAAGETTLVSPLPSVNAELDRAGNLSIPMIASDPQSRAYVPSSSGVLYRFDGNNLNATAVVAIGRPPLRDVVRDAQLRPDQNLSYLGTASGLSVCGYTPGTGAQEPCSTFQRSGGGQLSNNFLSVLRLVDSRNVDSLLVGTDNGLFIMELPTGSVRGSTILRGRVIYDMVALRGQAALATDNGLTLLVPSNQQTVRFGINEGMPSNTLRSLTVAGDNTLWIASAAGLAHFEPGSNRTTVWNTTRGLPSNNTTGVAVQRVTQLSPARDVVWVSTAAGIARLDTLTGAVTTFTTADGLPSNDTLAVHVLANGTKLFGTASGLAHYLGY